MTVINPGVTNYTPGLNPTGAGGASGSPGVGGAAKTGTGAIGQQGDVPGASDGTGGTTGAHLAPSGPSPNGLDPQAAMQQLQSFLSMAQDLNLVGALLIKFANEQQKDALQQRLGARAEAKQDLLNQAGDMRTSAKEIRNAAIASLVISVVSAAVTLFFAYKAGKAEFKAGSELKTLEPKTTMPKTPKPGEKMGLPEEEGAVGNKKPVGKKAVESENVGAPETSVENTGGKPKTDATKNQDAKEAESKKTAANKKAQQESEEDNDALESLKDEQKKIQDRELKLKKVDQLNRRAQNLSTLGGGLSQGLQGLANFVSSEGQAESKLSEADGSEQAALAQDAEAQEDVAKNTMEAAQQLVNQIINLLKELGDAKAEAMQSMTRV